jgi:hypothetical protein
MNKTVFAILASTSIVILLCFTIFRNLNTNKILKSNVFKEIKVTSPAVQMKIYARNSTRANRIILKIKEFYDELSLSEMKIYSQNKEDGIIGKLLQLINKTHNGIFVEFGAEDGAECNTRNLRENFNWTGLYMDGSNENVTINLHKETITHSNILDLFAKYNVRDNIDLLSEDTDYADYWIIEKILTKYQPKVVVHEINQQLPEFCVTVPKPDNLIFWDEPSTFRTYFVL